VVSSAVVIIAGLIAGRSAARQPRGTHTSRSAARSRKVPSASRGRRRVGLNAAPLGSGTSPVTALVGTDELAMNSQRGNPDEEWRSHGDYEPPTTGAHQRRPRKALRPSEGQHEKNGPTATARPSLTWTKLTTWNSRKSWS